MTPSTASTNKLSNSSATLMKSSKQLLWLAAESASCVMWLSLAVVLGISHAMISHRYAVTRICAQQHILPHQNTFFLPSDTTNNPNYFALLIIILKDSRTKGFLAFANLVESKVV